ncbi:MAG: hypothetical protein GQ529_04830 [Methyloprofundus sp.]|nr:hypothetical protein [Methyloprofundus sp.]
MRVLCIVEADAGRLEPNDSPRGESIFVTGSPKIYHEARGGAPIKFQFGLKDEHRPFERKQLTEEKINQKVKPGEIKADVITRLTGT